MAIQIILNGQTRTFDDLNEGATISELITTLKIQHDRVAIELNGSIAPRKNWEAMTVTSGDRIEMVHFVGGGSES